MTRPINISANNKTYEVRIVIKENDEPVRLPKNFFKNVNPAEFVQLSTELLKSTKPNMTWIDTQGVVYNSNSGAPEKFSEAQKFLWEKVEKCVLDRYTLLQHEGWTDDDDEGEIELDAATPASAQARRPAATTLSPSPQASKAAPAPDAGRPDPAPQASPAPAKKEAEEKPLIPVGRPLPAQEDATPAKKQALAAEQLRAQTLADQLRALQNSSDSTLPSFGKLYSSSVNEILEWINSKLSR